MVTRRSLDGTEEATDGTEGMPRDGTARKPRDKTLIRKGIFVNRPLGPVMGEVCPLVKNYELGITNYE